MRFTDLVVVNGFNDTVSARYSDVSGLRIGRQLPDQIARLIKVNRSDVDAADAERAKGEGEGGAANRRKCRCRGHRVACAFAFFRTHSSTAFWEHRHH